MSENNGLPKGWADVPLSCVTSINPSRGEILHHADSPVHFVPMASVVEEFGGVNVSTCRPYSEVQKGYTAFRENDVLFAKITPCMENGKLAVIPPLQHGLGFGSTEFHVLRPTEAVTASWVAHFLSQSGRRKDARRNMTGSAGQLRVPTTWLHDQLLPIPPLPEQHRIVEKIEELFSDLDAGVSALLRAKANLKRYRASVLKSAVEGRLTEEWRKEHPQAEDGQVLLDRILRERREKWEKDQLLNFKEKGKEPPKNWESKYEEPSAPDTSELPDLPEGWVWGSLEAAAFFQNGHAFPSKDYADEGVRLLRPGNLFDDGTVKWTDKNTRCLPEKWENECPGHIVGEHEVVMNLTAQSLKDDFLGRACLTGEGEKCLLNQRLARITPISAVIPRYLLFLLKSRLFREFVKGLNTGSLIQHMFTSQLKGFVFPLPPLAEQEQIVSLVEERLSQIDSAEKTIDSELIRSKRLRQSILKRAFEGKLVPQDPKDEPASVLLEQIKASRDADQPKKKSKRVGARVK
jgi:type I restriction enzyme, S subunit